jgi:hypothetical protein
MLLLLLLSVMKGNGKILLWSKVGINEDQRLWCCRLLEVLINHSTSKRLRNYLEY